jgi:hemerythrin superfamily protein
MNKSTEEKSGDAIDLLKSDHREVEKAFAQFEKLADDDHSKKKELADHICDELLIHMSIEEEIFYPAVKDGKGLDEIVNEGVV